MDDSRGANTCRLYNDGGDLKITAGKIGIDDGTVIGVCDVTAETIDMSGVSAGNWAKIELSVSGSAYTIEIADIAGETTELIIPAAVKAAYVDTKRGYYLTATKRLIGIAWKTAAGALGWIYNTENGLLGFKETKIIEKYDGTSFSEYSYRLKITYKINGWNMDADESKGIPHLFASAGKLCIRNISAVIINDGGGLTLVQYATNTPDPSLRSGGVSNIDNTNIYLSRRTGGNFDGTLYDDDTINRGFVTVEVEV
jgi:hypothetical protein